MLDKSIRRLVNGGANVRELKISTCNFVNIFISLCHLICAPFILRKKGFRGKKIFKKEKENEILNSEIFKIQKNPRLQFYISTNSTACHTCKPINRSLKTASMAVSKSTKNDVTLTPFVADLSYPGLSSFYIMCEIDSRESADSLTFIFAFV